jgi:serine protease Do
MLNGTHMPKRYLTSLARAIRVAAVCVSLVIGGTAFAEDGKPAATAKQDAKPEGVKTSTAPAAAKETRTLWQLKGGGEIFGNLIKETPEAVFVDIGPEVIRIPVAGIERRLTPEEFTAEAQKNGSMTGGGSGVFDPETGSVIFRRRDSSNLKSQTEILNAAKRSVVLVSNSRGRGSGWVLDKEGRIVTNHHVIGNEKYQTVTIFVQKGNQWERKRIDDCKVEAFSKIYDISIVRLNMDKVREEGIELYPVTIAAPNSLEAGEPVFAIGNPGMGGQILEHSISEGIVSSLARNFDDIIYVQTTAAVNPGNSGGPLLNAAGEVVGLITLKATFQEGIAFALPGSLIMHFLETSKAFEYSETNRNQGYKYLPPS